MPEPKNRPRNGIQTDDFSAGQVAQTGRSQSHAQDNRSIAFKDGIKQLQNDA
jgi:hypothetical protein